MSHLLEPFFEERARERASHDPVFSEAWERPTGAFHERAGVLLTERLAEVLPGGLRDAVLAIYTAGSATGSWCSALKSLVSGEFDVDRLDYLVRDSLHQGTEFGAIDVERLVASLVLVRPEGRFRIVPSLRARSAFETLLVSRTQAYRWVAFHPRVLASNLSMARSVEFLHKLSSNTAQAWADGPTAASLFAPINPPTDYIEPALGDLADTGFLDGRLSDGLAEYEGVAVADRIRDHAAAAIDDDTVVAALHRALLTAEVAIERGGALEELTRLSALTRAALHRSPLFYCLWKSPEQYGRIADELLADGLREVVAAAGLQDTDEQALVGDGGLSGSAIVNRLCRLVLVEQVQRERLCRQLEGASPREMGSGWWDVVYNGFSPVKLAAVELFSGNQRVLLSEVSPIVGHLAEADEQRPWITVFFFSAAGVAGRADQRFQEMARAVFVKTFLSFVEGELRNAAGV